MKRFLTALTGIILLIVLAATAQADSFGMGGNQFTLDFVPISGSSNPTEAQANDTNRGLYGLGIVEYDYRMGVYEITNSQWDKFTVSLGVPVMGDPSSAYDQSFYDFGTGTTDVPTNCVTWYEVAQFVNWLNTSTNHQAAYKFTGTQGQSDYTFATSDAADAWGGTNLYRHKDAYYFLPTEDEWFKAAYWNGSEIQDYATKAGDTLHQGDGTSGTGWNYKDGDDGGPAGPAYGPWDVGSGSEELNGTYDIMGNNWELMESPWDDPNYATDSIRGSRGGHWSLSSGLLAASARYNDLPWVEGPSIGFRVASVPEPGTITLLLCGLASLLCWRRRN
ncbi:MAG: SUMF1/EgtB/PvdO family nonheme iron enzyme [Pirellulales bacterium]|nr:SUMF1/EgtB/PvdO family nonheme iron enzyme [Pirellulales bacterium]